MKAGGNLQIVATLGPASRGMAGILRAAGATAFRLNASHMAAGELGVLAASVRRELPDCPLVVDLRGAKMRLGIFSELPVRRGERYRFSLVGAEGSIPLPHPEIFAGVAAGETLSCDDARLSFRIEKVAPDAIEGISLSDGTLRPRKGVNVVEHPVNLDDLGAEDLACIGSAAGPGGVAFAFSFMKDGGEAEWVRRRAPGSRIIGKVERREAAASVQRVAGLVDELWICRGDLGAQLGPAAMARWISEYSPRGASCPVLMAGQVLEHLTQHSGPTRSEVCHLYDLVRRGYAGFVLSDETAIGTDPAGAVRSIRALLSEFAALT